MENIPEILEENTVKIRKEKSSKGIKHHPRNKKVKKVKKKNLRTRKVIASKKRRNFSQLGHKASKYSGRFWNGVAVVKHLPVGKYAIAPTKYLSKSTQFAIIDKSVKIGKKGNWVFRLDKPHKGVDFSHMNINKRITGIRDPHAKVPDGVVTAAGGLNKTLKVVGVAALVASVAFDAYRIGSAVRGDLKKKGQPSKETGKTVASVGSGYAGGAAGAFGGNALGGWIGGGIGAMFGGVGAIPGAAIGSIVGGVIGGIGGAVGGSIAAEKAVDKFVSDSDDYEDIDDEDDAYNRVLKKRILKKTRQMSSKRSRVSNQKTNRKNKSKDCNHFEAKNKEV